MCINRPLWGRGLGEVCGPSMHLEVSATVLMICNESRTRKPEHAPISGAAAACPPSNPCPRAPQPQALAQAQAHPQRHPDTHTVHSIWQSF